MFKKLQGAENYKQWNRDMTLALQDTKFWHHITGFATRPPKLAETSDDDNDDDDDDREERIYQRWQLIQDFDQDVREAATKISRMCTDTVQNEFLAIKPSNEWDPKELWDWLKKRYTLQDFASKWNALEKLHAIRHSQCKNVTEYMSRIKAVAAEIGDLKITISEAVVIHALSNLDSNHSPYLSAILRHDAREKGKLPTLSELTKALEDDEQMRLVSQMEIGERQTILTGSKHKKIQTGRARQKKGVWERD